MEQPDPATSETPPSNQLNLPFSSLKPFIIGAAYGLVMRLIFYFYPTSRIYGGEYDNTMTWSFIMVTPVIVGAATIYYAEKVRTRSPSYYILAPWAAIGLFLIGTAISLIEGSICIVMIAPLFLILASIGGVIMGYICRAHKRITKHFPVVVIAPFALMLVEVRQPVPDSFHELQISEIIIAKPEQVWTLINSAQGITAQEFQSNFATKIGAPHPVSGVTQTTPEGLRRFVTWERGIHFEEAIVEWKPNQFIRWNYLFSENSFPEGSLDDHVKIGGQYFDLMDTSYQLTPVPQGTKLTIKIHYRISTAFNWYAVPLCNWLIEGYVKSILGFYKQRIEHQQ